ncbi:hypothetical protein GCM10025867_31440 [Frondihabitans sucicola]|uniref:Uncharacterized protein n=1 Tax=Frondihabitans sucicola TaxID=1268041 RepID=A0ABM8GR16_9MICO|nr:hypothetical protein [Frondihabitans sucicola]BDZ50903.1 hypothetical protein GCM10025867_31440 [Frondihabitans sucicola]
MTMEPTSPVFTMLGDAAAEACEGDSCLVPGTAAAARAERIIDIEPTPQEAAAASARAVAAALDEGASL